MCVQALTDERVELAVDTLKLYAPLEVRVVPSAEDADERGAPQPWHNVAMTAG